MRNYIIFSLRNFLFDTDQNATVSLLAYLRLIQLSCTPIFSGNCALKKCFIIITMMILYLLHEVCNSDTVRCNFDALMQLSWWFYVSEWVMPFLHWDKQISRHFFCLEQNMQFLSGGYSAFSRYPINKQTVPIDTACLPWSEIAKPQKSPKIDWHKNSTMVKTCYLPNWKYILNSFSFHFTFIVRNPFVKQVDR